MATNFPTSLDNLTNPLPTDSQAVVSHADQHSNANDAIEAIEAKVGINGSTNQNSHDYKLSGVTGADKAVSRTGNETLTNKTLTSPTINNGTIVSPTISNPTVSGTSANSANTTYSGSNTFSILPTLSNTPVNGTDAANKTYVDNMIATNVIPNVTAVAGENITAGNYVAYYKARNSISLDVGGTDSAGTAVTGSGTVTYSIPVTATGSNKTLMMAFAVYAGSLGGSPSLSITSVSITGGGTVTSHGGFVYSIYGITNGTKTLTVNYTISGGNFIGGGGLYISYIAYANVSQTAPTTFTSGSTNISTLGSLIFSAGLGGSTNVNSNNYGVSGGTLRAGFSSIGDSGVIESTGVTPITTASVSLLLLPANTFSREIYKCNAQNINLNTYDGNKNNYVGVAKATVSAGASITFEHPYVLTGLSGLVPDLKYYINDSGNVSTTQGTNLVLLGRAISTTEISLLLK